MGIRLVSETPYSQYGLMILRLESALNLTNGPITPMAAVSLPGSHNTRLSAVAGGKRLHCNQVALEVAACDAESGFQISVRTNPSIEAECGDDLVPIGANRLTNFGQGVGGGDG